MKILYQDLINHFSNKPSKDLLSEKLFQLGHEHELNGDVYDMELTPNRGDCNSLIGLSRDLAVFFGKSNSIDLFSGDIKPLKIDFENLSPKDCPKISFLEIEIEDSEVEYKPYLKNYFNTIGGNKTNLFTDVSNYISYELGQPTHCFEADAIQTKLIFENIECNTTFKTLLGSEVTLKNRNCVFTMDDEVISLAGVMGGESTACSKETKKVLVECAYFNPESIIGKSIKYNLVSDAAHKFERGVDIASQEMVLRRFIKLVQDHAKIKSIRFKSFTEDYKQKPNIPIEVNKINKILGTSLKNDECLMYLNELGFDISDEIKVPTYRHDIETINDIAEEIARVIGYNNIQSSPVNLQKTSNDQLDKVAKLESFLVESGFYEVINFPFISNNEKKSINIDNPLDSNRNNFRVSLKNSLIENLLYNERRQKDSVKLFEISDIYTKDDVEIKQQKKLGLIISGRQGYNYNNFSKKLDKKYLDNLLNKSHDEDIFEIIEISRDSLNTKRKDKIFYVEIPFKDIPLSFFSKLSSKHKAINFINYKAISEYPVSSRDFSFVIEDIQIVHKIIDMLNNISDEIIKDSFLFDYYKDDKRQIIKLGHRFIFQSHLKTLSDEEINEKVNEILKPILKIESVSIPGMY